MNIRHAVPALVILIALGGSARAEDAAPPRYRLATGQEITYLSQARSDRDDKRTYIVYWKIWVLDREADGSFRLVIRCDLATRSAGPQPKPDDESVDTLIWKCRLFDDGRLVGATTRGTVRDPSRIFPKLPGGPEAIVNGWESPGPKDEQTRIRYKVAGPPKVGDPILTIDATCSGPEDRVYVLEHATRSTFDHAQGLVTRVETEDKSGYGIKGIIRGTIELVSAEQKGAEWATKFGRDADAYFRGVEAYESRREQAARDAVQGKALLAEAKAELRAVREQVEGSFLREALDKTLAGHDRAARSIAEQAGRRAALVGKPAPDWEAKDVDGKIHRLVDYRGRVVVMDFWYRGCGWCMTAMPQVKQVAEAFRDEPVSVLGMSIDEDVKDAQVVIEALALNYPTIRAAGLPERFEVQGYPTLIVVDPRGLVREVHVGYSPRLHDDLSRLIRDLLAEKPR